MDQEVVGVADGPAAPAERPDDHPVLVQHAGVLALPLVGVSERNRCRLHEARVGADGEKLESARKGGIG